MKITDVIAEILKKNSVSNVFGLQGGAVVHIFDSLIKKKIDVTFTHHEETAALAAVSNAKSNDQIGCAVVTTGPGTTNAITGLLAAWQDSIPVIFISGQARSSHTSYGKKVRQVGTQEVNICDIVKPITKYTNFIKDKNKVISEFEKAIQIAKSGRPGPVWLDLALEVQWQEVKLFKKFNKIKSNSKFKIKTSKLSKAIQLINKANNPIFIIGYGVRSSGINPIYLKRFFKKKNIYFVGTWNSADLIETSFSYNLGIIGMSGQRGANKAAFSSDLLVCVGTHLSIPHTTTLYDNYSPNSKKIIVNIDPNQLENLNVKFDLKINLDAKLFLEKINKSIKKKESNKLGHLKKINWYQPSIKKYPESNSFVRKITENIKGKSCIVVDGGGTALYAGFQSSIIKKGNRIICSSAISSMGTGLAETIGAHKSNKFKNIICIIGDGSFLMNCQDLQTIFQEKTNVKIIIVNNNGYLAIRHTQKEFLNKRYRGTLPPYDISFPNFQKLAKSFKIKYLKIKSPKKAEEFAKKINVHKGPIIVDLIVDENQSTLFKQGYKKNINGTFAPMDLSEMYPYVDIPIANTNN